MDFDPGGRHDLQAVRSLVEVHRQVDLTSGLDRFAGERTTIPLDLQRSSGRTDRVECEAKFDRLGQGRGQIDDK